MTDEAPVIKRGAMTPARMKRIWEREQGICWRQNNDDRA